LRMVHVSDRISRADSRGPCAEALYRSRPESGLKALRHAAEAPRTGGLRRPIGPNRWHSGTVRGTCHNGRPAGVQFTG